VVVEAVVVAVAVVELPRATNGATVVVERPWNLCDFEKKRTTTAADCSHRLPHSGVIENDHSEAIPFVSHLDLATLHWKLYWNNWWVVVDSTAAAAAAAASLFARQAAVDPPWARTPRVEVVVPHTAWDTGCYY
jgi:hypothetical protein